MRVSPLDIALCTKRTLHFRWQIVYTLYEDWSWLINLQWCSIPTRRPIENHYWWKFVFGENVPSLPSNIELHWNQALQNFSQARDARLFSYWQWILRFRERLERTQRFKVTNRSLILRAKFARNNSMLMLTLKPLPDLAILAVGSKLIYWRKERAMQTI